MKQILILVALMLTVSVFAKGKEGVASYYHDSLDGNLTANGEVYRVNKITCAHKTLPFGTVLIVTNKKNNKSVVVRVNDRGPFIKGRDIDLSRRAAKSIQMISRGVVKVKYTVINDVAVKHFKDINKILYI